MSIVYRGPSGHRIGSSHPRARHSAATVAEARRLYAAGLGYRAIGKRLNVAWRTVADWVRGETRWADEGQVSKASPAGGSKHQPAAFNHG